MSDMEREDSREGPSTRSQTSTSDGGRFIPPMWDSSDPARAPPPLPLNPGRSSPVSKPSVSPNIAAAAEALAAKGRESNYVTNPMPSRSPEKGFEKSLIRGPLHRRMNSFQPENIRPSPLSPNKDRKSTFDYRTPETSPTRQGPDNTLKDFTNTFPELRPSSRSSRAITGEPSPQSATMKALQAPPTEKKDEMDSASSTPMNSNLGALIRQPQSFEGIATQILSLTSICTSLQREMAQLSRRSKDNATDLSGLRDATHARDEDIRVTLKELVSNFQTKKDELKSLHEAAARDLRQRSASPQAEFLDKPSPTTQKSFSLPRMPTSLGSSLAGGSQTPNPWAIEGAASIALLEKIHREMATREGQEKLQAGLADLPGPSMEHPEVVHSPAAPAAPLASLIIDPDVTKKLGEIIALLKDGQADRDSVGRRLDEIVGLVKDNAQSRALVRVEQPREIPSDITGSSPMSMMRAAQTRLADMSRADVQEVKHSAPSVIVNDDVMKLLKRLKDSVSESGGMTAETKALVRELRGEVLGMGREIAKKLEQKEATKVIEAPEAPAPGPDRDEIAEIVQEGLAELKEHLDKIMQEHRRQSNASLMSRNVVDTEEIYNVVTNALKEMPVPEQAVVQQRDPEAERDAIMRAVKEAWENYKPDLSIDMDGLQRDEILDCLREGLEQHKPKDDASALGGATYEEVMDAVRQGLEDFKPPPPPETEASITKEEIMTAVRECLETFDFPMAGESQARGMDFSKDDILATVKEGLESHEAKEKDTTLAIEAEDLIHAVKVGLQDLPMGELNAEVLDRTQGLIDEMKAEFQQYSAANGRDTEQVLDALNDGMENLRSSIESYVDRASDVTGKDEIIDTVREGLDQLRVELGASLETIRQSGGGATNTSEILDSMEKEFEHLRSTLTALLRSESDESSPGGREELLDAIREGFEDLKTNMPKAGSSSLDEDLSSRFNEELHQIRESLSSAVTRAGPDLSRGELFEVVREAVEQCRVPSGMPRDGAESYLSNTSELLDAFNGGLDDLKADINKLSKRPEEPTLNHEILEALKEGLASVRDDIDRLHHAQAERRDSDSTVRDGAVVVADPNAPKVLERNDIKELELMINQLKTKFDTLEAMSQTTAAPMATAEPDPMVREDIGKVNDLVLELQESIAALSAREIPVAANAATKDDTEAIETLLRNTKAHLEDLQVPENVATADGLSSLEELIKGTRDVVDDLATRHESEVATKDDIANLEVLAKELQTSLEEIKSKDSEEKIVKDDLNGLEVVCAELKEKVDGLSTEGEALTTKTDIEGLTLIVKEFQEKLQAEVAELGLGLGARKTEHGEMTDKVEEVRLFIETARDELKVLLDSRKEEIEGIATSIDALGETITGGGAAKEFHDTITHEFERAHANHEATKLDFEQHRDTLIAKHDEHKDAVIAELGAKIDEKFSELATKYEDALLASDAKTTTLEEVSTKQGEAVEAARALSEELKVSIDSLVPTITASCDRMTEDGKAAFLQVESLHSKVDEGFSTFATDNKAEHSETRAELIKATQALESIQSHADEFNPKILTAIADVLERLSEQTAEARKSAEEIKTTVDAIPGNITLPALPEAPSAVERTVEPVEKFDDSEIQTKLNTLIEYAAEAGKASAQSDLLQEIKDQVATTAADLDAFVKSQQAAAIDAQESKARESEEIAIALEKRTAQKESVEADIVRLIDEKNLLTETVDDLTLQQKELTGLKSKMQADLSSLETALHIRREEMKEMEARAENLERRILEGVLDHSRSLLLNARPKDPLKEMNLKRVPSAVSNITVTTKPSSTRANAPPYNSSAISNGIGMALKKRGAPTRSGASTPKGERRILSLSTIGANKAAADKAMVLANPVLASTTAAKNASGSMKRSHSVKSNFPSRKTSWGGTKQPGLYGDMIEEDKENSIFEDEEDRSIGDRTSLGGQTNGRTSYAGTHTDSMSYVTDSLVTSSELDHDDEETGSVLDSTAANVHQPNEEDSDNESEPEMVSPSEYADANPSRKSRPWIPADSGLGSELPTGTVGGAPSEYFGRD